MLHFSWNSKVIVCSSHVAIIGEARIFGCMFLFPHFSKSWIEIVIWQNQVTSWFILISIFFTEYSFYWEWETRMYIRIWLPCRALFDQGLCDSCVLYPQLNGYASGSLWRLLWLCLQWLGQVSPHTVWLITLGHLRGYVEGKPDSHEECSG